eukprot:s2722_g12.t1
MNFHTWAACLPRWILKTRTQFARCLASSFSVVRRSADTASTAFPLPLATLDSFQGSGPKLSCKRFWNVCKARLLNIWILVLDFMFLGRWPTCEELGRCPNSEQLAIFERLRTFLAVSGDAQASFSLCPGRSSPELGAALFQIERFCAKCPEMKSGYMERDEVPFREDAALLPVEQFPQLLPYRSLDSSRLRLVGEGKWPMESFLDGVLWLPFQEPRFLLHGLPVSCEDQPRFEFEKPEECLALAKLWDVRGLLHLGVQPVCPGHFSRVFNCFKSAEADRQIGDRRIVNHAEFHVDGPSKHLPQGQQLCMLRLPRYTHMLRGSITDRRDFYHQAQVSNERAESNMLPFSYPLDFFSNTQALEQLKFRTLSRVERNRESIGDGLRALVQPSDGRKPKRSPALPDRVYPCFRSLFQGDHLGVEFALKSHSVLLEGGGLLNPSSRILGHHGFPPGPAWDALVIDDYFALSCEPLTVCDHDTFAMKALVTARRLYEKEELLGSTEKDIVASPNVKAAGAEIRSEEKNVRMGVVPVGAPFEKRLALAVLSLRAACLPGISPKLASRLAGNWVSLLQYRKCWSCLVDSLFGFATAAESWDEKVILSLSRGIAQELSVLAAVAPIIFSNIAVDYLGELFATDASNQKGAIVAAPIDPKLAEVVWLSSDKKGAYSHLDNDFRAILRQTGFHDDAFDAPSFDEHVVAPSKPPLLYFDFVEICGGAGKVSKELDRLGHSVAPPLDLSDSQHYGLCSLRLLEWIIYMLEENRFRSFLIAPPCTTFSPAAHPAVRSYKQPLGFDRNLPKTLLGNTLAFRALVLMRVGHRCRRPCGLEQSRLSKMAWLALWRSLLLLDFHEAIVASCMFGSPHRKEFRLLCFLLDVDFLTVRCCGGHSHLRIEGKYTKPSAVYVDGVAAHFAHAYHKSLLLLDAEERLMPEVDGLESIVINDLALSSKWQVVRSWFWKRVGHINVLELASAVSSLQSVGQQKRSVRFLSLVDSAVCRGALTKGRRLVVMEFNLVLLPGFGSLPMISPGSSLLSLSLVGRSAAPFVLSPGFCCSSLDFPEDSSPCGFAGSCCLFCRGMGDSSLDFPEDSEFPGVLEIGLCLCRGLGFLSMDLPESFLVAACLCMTFGSFLCLWSVLSVSCPVAPPKGKRSHSFLSKRWVALAMVFCLFDAGKAMPLTAQTAADRQRLFQRSEAILSSTRAVKQQTRDRRKIYLDRFRTWLLHERGISLQFLLEQKPADLERIASFLVEYGKELFYAGRAYGIYSETINSIAAERPLIKRQLTHAWDLAFAWLVDEPTVHHPAMPLSIMTALCAVAITWGWPYEAAVIMLSWAGIMRIGEVISATRSDLVLPVDTAPGTSFMLVMIRQPKTRGTAARHQAARVDQTDIIRFLSAMFASSPKEAKVWPFSAATLRKRFQKLLEALRLPSVRSGKVRPFDLGSMRPGGATWLLNQVENSEIVRRRGRWVTAKTMEIYLQESFVSTFLQTLDQRTRTRIQLCSGGFAAVLERAIGFLDSGIPPKAWFALFKMTARLPTEEIGKDGSSGEIFGPDERVSRAIDLPRSWGSASDPDSALWQMAELVPGADAVAFAVHLQGGYYAQALRSVTKTSWVNVRTEELILCIRCDSLLQIWCNKVDILHVDVIPRQFSLVVGLSDLATNFLEIDREGQRRHIKDPEASGEETQRTAMALSKELVKGVVDEILALRIDYFTRNVPTYADWVVEFLNGYLLPKYRQERVRVLETKVRAMELNDLEEVRAIETIKLAAKQHGLDISGGIIRRTSSRFCLGVEHGDYNGTELFGVGTDRFIWMGYKPNDSGRIRIFSQNFPEKVVEFKPGEVPAPKSASISETWARFPYGVEHVLRTSGFDTSRGFDAVLMGNIPGGGMSRSASLVINLMLTMLEVNKKSLPEGDFRIVKMAQQVENDYIGNLFAKSDA